jgi:hypothetical protein
VISLSIEYNISILESQTISYCHLELSTIRFQTIANLVSNVTQPELLERKLTRRSICLNLFTILEFLHWRGRQGLEKKRQDMDCAGIIERLRLL